MPDPSSSGAPVTDSRVGFINPSWAAALRGANSSFSSRATEIPRRLCSASVPRQRNKNIIIWETIVNPSSGAKYFHPRASWSKELEEEAFEQLKESAQVSL